MPLTFPALARVRSLGALLLLSLTFAASAQAQKETTPLPFNPQDGEAVVFLGDSITHQCLYTQYLENFFITRYPDRRIHFHNAGVSGDKAGDALARFEHDVAALKPDYVTILLGMNDGQYEDFNAETFETYRNGMTEIVSRIKELGATPIILSPTMFDHHIVETRIDDEDWRFRTREFSPYYNALLAFYGGWALEEAGRQDVPFVNLWGPLNEHTIEQRRLDPDFSLVYDAIHPQASGQMVMAFETLFQLGVEQSSKGAVSINRRGDRWISRSAKDIQVNEDGTEMTFTSLANSLPWVIPAAESSMDLKWGLPSDGRLGYKITKAGHKLSADRLKVVGLEPGNYEVAIDGQVIGTWNHVTLGTKIEIQENDKTPQFQQALEVALMNQKRNDEIIRPLRDTWARIKRTRNSSAESKDAEMEKLLAEATKLRKEADAQLDAIYAAAQPVEHTWTLRKLADK